MRNFNNIRTIDLKEYLPDVLKDVQEMRAIMEAETPEVQAIWDACEDCMNDQFISEATENGRGPPGENAGYHALRDRYS